MVNAERRTNWADRESEPDSLATTTDATTTDFDRSHLRSTIERLIGHCPRRAPGSADERTAQEMLGDEFVRAGGECQWHSFRYAPNLYAVLALHFGLATVASGLFLVSPLAAFALHVTVLVSYVAEALRLVQPLRRLLPRRESQNLLACFPASAPLRRRVIVMAHADAAFTGWIFSLHPPRPFRWPPLRLLQRPMLMAVVGLVICATIDVRAFWPESLFWWTYPSYFGWTVYFALIALVNLQVVWNNRTVPGANDNFAACVGLTALAERLAEEKPDDVELVFVVTGSEEAGTGGALALVRDKRSEWDREKTAIVNLDGIADGDLRILEEGDVVHLSATPWLKELVYEVAQERGHDKLETFTIPVGATDALPFLVRGYPAVSIGCLDPARGAPTHYHTMNDSPENLDYDQMVTSLDLTEGVVRRLGQLPSSPEDPALEPAAARKPAPADRPESREAR